MILNHLRVTETFGVIWAIMPSTKLWLVQYFRRYRKLIRKEDPVCRHFICKPVNLGHLDRYGYLQRHSVLDDISRSWKCTVRPRDGCDNVIVQRLGAAKRREDVEFAVYELSYRQVWRFEFGKFR